MTRPLFDGPVGFFKDIAGCFSVVGGLVAALAVVVVGAPVVLEVLSYLVSEPVVPLLVIIVVLLVVLVVQQSRRGHG